MKQITSLRPFAGIFPPALRSLCNPTVSYTHLTLPTIGG